MRQRSPKAFGRGRLHPMNWYQALIIIILLLVGLCVAVVALVCISINIESRLARVARFLDAREANRSREKEARKKKLQGVLDE